MEAVVGLEVAQAVVQAVNPAVVSGIFGNSSGGSGGGEMNVEDFLKRGQSRRSASRFWPFNAHSVRTGISVKPSFQDPCPCAPCAGG